MHIIYNIILYIDMRYKINSHGKISYKIWNNGKYYK